MSNYQPTPKKIPIFSTLKDTLYKQLEVTVPSLRIELLGNQQVILEGTTGIIEYSHTTVRLNSKKHMIKIVGSDLVLRGFQQSAIVVEGHISGVELL